MRFSTTTILLSLILLRLNSAAPGFSCSTATYSCRKLVNEATVSQSSFLASLAEFLGISPDAHTQIATSQTNLDCERLGEEFREYFKEQCDASSDRKVKVWYLTMGDKIILFDGEFIQGPVRASSPLLDDPIPDHLIVLNSTLYSYDCSSEGSHCLKIQIITELRKRLSNPMNKSGESQKYHAIGSITALALSIFLLIAVAVYFLCTNRCGIARSHRNDTTGNVYF